MNDPQMVVLLWKVLETLRDRTQLEEAVPRHPQPCPISSYACSAMVEGDLPAVPSLPG